jgi:group I intron endonuclease
MQLYSIYKITNNLNQKCYIGFSENPDKRWKSHKKQRKSSKTKLSRALQKYTPKNFTFEIIYQSTFKNFTLQVMENFFIEKYDSIRNGYNIQSGGMGGDWRNGKSKEEIQIINKKKGKIGKYNPFYGKKHSKEAMERSVATRKLNSNGSYGSYIKGMGKNPKNKFIYNGNTYPSKINLSITENLTRYQIDKLINSGDVTVMGDDSLSYIMSKDKLDKTAISFGFENYEQFKIFLMSSSTDDISTKLNKPRKWVRKYLRRNKIRDEKLINQYY